MKKRANIKVKYSLFPVQDIESEDDDSWQVSYLDIITIVLGFLIILLSVSQITKSEFTSLSSIFGKLADETEFITTPIGNIQDELFTLLQPEIEAGNLEVIRDLNDLRIRFNSDDLYNSGQAKLETGSEYLLDRVLIAMQQLEYNDFNIDVEGHTDNTPIASVAFPSNWELSTARAANVVKYFNDMGIPAKRLKASGYADSRPVIEYDSLGFPFAASKERNRRVVLRLYYSTDNLIEERLGNEITEDAITQESLGSELPEITAIPPTSSEGEIVVLADQPAMVTLFDQNQIEESISENSTTVPEEEVSEAVQDLSEPEPIDVEIEDEPTPDPVQETTPDPPAVASVESVTLTNTLPSLLNVDARCQFAVQLGEFDALQTAFQQAARIESAIDAPVILTYNNQNYSIRTESSTSFPEALDQQNAIASRLNDADIGVVHQCYNNTISRPKPVKYLIQFGAFQNRTNGLNFSMELFDEYNIQSYMNRVSDSYNVLTGPYTSRDEVLAQLQTFREKGISTNLFIRHQPETVFKYDYAYQIQLNSFTSTTAANNLVDQIRSNTGINARVEELVNGTFTVMSDQSQNWNEIQTIFNRVRNSSIDVRPVIFFLEYTP